LILDLDQTVQLLEAKIRTSTDNSISFWWSEVIKLNSRVFTVIFFSQHPIRKILRWKD